MTGRHVVKPAPDKKVEPPSDVSMARFREVTGGDAELARGLTASFAQSVTQALTDIEGGLAREDLDLVRRAAHTLVGTSANMGATRLQAIAIAMEDSATQKNGAAVGELLDAARSRFTSARVALEKESG